MLNTEWGKPLIQTVNTQVTDFCPIFMGVKADSVIGADLSTHLAAGALRLVYENNPIRSLFDSLGGTDLKARGLWAMQAMDTLET